MGRSGFKYIAVIFIALIVSFNALSASDPGYSLSRGVFLVKVKEYSMAEKELRESLNSGHLNILGRAVAYWNLYVIYKNTNNKEKIGNELMSFLIVSQDILESDDPDIKSFAKDQSISVKHDIAKKEIEQLWRERSEPPIPGSTHPIP